MEINGKTVTAYGTIEYDEGAITAHMTNTNNPHVVTYKQAGAAPAGFGLGERSGALIDSCNDAIRAGFYAAPSKGFAEGSFPTGYGNFKYGTLLVETRGDTRVQQTIKHDYYEAKRALTYSGGAWNFGAWEYVSVPLGNGVEYRTTERYDRDPVYVKLVDLKAFAADAYEKTVDLGITNIAKVVDASFVAVSKDGAHYFNAPDVKWRIICPDGAAKCVFCDFSEEMATAKLTLKYTKTTG